MSVCQSFRGYDRPWLFLYFCCISCYQLKKNYQHKSGKYNREYRRKYSRKYNRKYNSKYKQKIPQKIQQKIPQKIKQKVQQKIQAENTAENTAENASITATSIRNDETKEAVLDPLYQPRRAWSIWGNVRSSRKRR